MIHPCLGYGPKEVGGAQEANGVSGPDCSITESLC